MARGSTSKPKPSKYAELDDGILDEDSEEDEFANYKASVKKASKGRQPPSDDEDEDDEEMMDEDDDEDEDMDSNDERLMYEDSDDEGDGVGVYEPDEWDGGADYSSSEDEDEDDERAQMKKLQKGLGSIPLDTLMKAQRSMKKSTKSTTSQQASYSDSEDDNAGGMTERERKVAAMKARLAGLQRAKGKALDVEVGDDDEAGPSRKRGPRFDPESDDERKSGRPAKRDNKHAPTAISTKRQVTRHRQVVDIPKVDRRDPRFSSLSGGPVDAHIHARGYAFMPDLLKTELKNLRASVAAAGKAERACKLSDKPRYTAERERLEKEMARVRTRLEKNEREAREREVLAKAKGEEREKRASGKGAWYMKKSEKKDLLLKARFAALEEKGGKHAVKKAVDKKLKKVAGKEKKSRPFVRGGGAPGGGGGDGGHQRRRV